MAEEEKNYMNWQDKIEAAKKVMQCLESIDTKDAVTDKEQDLLDVLEIVAKLLLPLKAVRLIVDRPNSL